MGNLIENSVGQQASMLSVPEPLTKIQSFVYNACHFHPEDTSRKGYQDTKILFDYFLEGSANYFQSEKTPVGIKI